MEANMSSTSAVPPVISWTSQPPPNEHLERDLFTNINGDINFEKYEKISVEATGNDVPHPFFKFEKLQIHPWIQQNIKKAGYMKPTPVQKYSIPTLLNGRDLMSCAQTGSGKTAAFLLPLIDHSIREMQNSTDKMISKCEQRAATTSPTGLVLCPTRELAIQTHKEAMKFAYRTNVVSALLYGGRENYSDQVNKLRKGCHLLVATPGRLLDLLSQNIVSLENCTFLVLDEADRMLDMGFEPQIRKVVDRHSMPRKEKRITAMFSATFPVNIQILAQDFLKPDYIFVAVGRIGSTSENIMQKIVLVEEENKKQLLVDLLEADDDNRLILIFVKTKRGANNLALYLQRKNFRVLAIHGDLKQYEREHHLNMFRTGKANILVATAVAARGLDIPNVKHVINFDLPNEIDEYVHRIGRTGRVGNVGLATSFFNGRNRNLSHDLMSLMIESSQEVPEWLEKMSNENSRVVKRADQKPQLGRSGARDYRLRHSGGYPPNMPITGTYAGAYPTPLAKISFDRFTNFQPRAHPNTGVALSQTISNQSMPFIGNYHAQNFRARMPIPLREVGFTFGPRNIPFKYTTPNAIAH